MHFRIGILGGTFDPVHNIHTQGAKEVIRELDLDKVILSPAGDPYHRERTSAPAHHRLAMTRLACATEPLLEVTDVDVTRDGPTYSIDTLRDIAVAFAREHPGDHADWFFIMGADAFAGIAAWKDPAHLADQATIVVITRPGYDIVKNQSIPHETIELPDWGTSGTNIRDLLSRGLDPGDLIAPAVRQYITEHNLYSPRN